MTDPEIDETERYVRSLNGLSTQALDRSLNALKAENPSLFEKVTRRIDRDSSGLTFQVDPENLSVFPAAETFEDVHIGPGAQIGPFRLQRFIGEGGMGAVYQALQEGLDRPVALKFMKSGLVSREARARFLYEAKLLSRLRHPGIAQVIEVGLHELGSGQISLPYYVLELVHEARPLNRFAADKALSRRDLVELFILVAEAVLHGHRMGVIHRDLKPANILVDADGRPKVIDFGLSREERDEDDTRSFVTETGAIVGTLPYMSPEQLGLGGTVDVRSDIYALGVILYELLCGCRPHEFKGMNLVDAMNVVRDQLPIAPRKIDPSIDRDLETICMKALRKDAAERYPTVDAFTNDLRCWLEEKPISARPQTATYQLRLFAQRNKGLVAAMLAFVLLLIVSTIGAIQLARTARAAEAQAQRSARSEKQRREQTERLLDVSTTLSNWLILDHLDQLVVLRGGTRLAEETSNRILSWLDEMQKEALGNDDLQRSLALAEYQVGSVLGAPYQPNLGKTKAALERVLAAEKVFAERLAEAPNDLDRLIDLVIPSLTRAEIQQMLGKSEEAEAAVDGVLAQLRGFEGTEEQKQRLIQVEAQALGTKANLKSQFGRPAEGLALIREAIELRRRLGETTAVDDANRIVLTDRMTELRLLIDLGRIDESRRTAMDLVRDLRPLAGADDPIRTNDLGFALTQLAEVLMHDTSTYGEAEGYLREALALRRAIFERDPEDTFARQSLALAQERLARILIVQGSDVEEALLVLGEAASNLRDLVMKAPESREFKGQLEILLGYSSEAASMVGMSELASKYAKERLDMVRSLLAKNPDDLSARRALAESETGLGIVKISSSTNDESAADRIAVIKESMDHFAEAKKIYQGFESLEERPVWLDSNLAAQDAYIAICQEELNTLEESQ